MKCRKIVSHLSAYADGELARRLRRAVDRHLETCESCRKRLEGIRRLNGLLQDSLPVPPVLDGFAARVRVQAEARRCERRAAPLSPQGLWSPFRWFVELSPAMRVASGATMILALLAGMALNGNRLPRGGAVSGDVQSLYGLEWFDQIPSGSVGQVYLAMISGERKP